MIATDQDTIQISPPDGIAGQVIDLRGQMLRVAFKDGPTDKPPLLMFNGIGAI